MSMAYQIPTKSGGENLPGEADNECILCFA